MAEREQMEAGETLQDNQRPYPGMPRWLKVLGIVTLLLVLLFVILHLTGNSSGMQMGPGMHMPPTTQGTQQP